MPSENKKTNPNAPSKRSTFGFAWYGALPGTRTLGPLIKSQLLSQTTNTKRTASFPSQIITLHKDESSLQPTICNFPLAIDGKAISIQKDKWQSPLSQKSDGRLCHLFEERKYMFLGVDAFTASPEEYPFCHALQGTLERIHYTVTKRAHACCFFFLADIAHQTSEATRPRPERI